MLVTLPLADVVKNKMTVKEIISEKIKDIEQKENIRIIHAVESGSRAWGFASPDSDYDVRFIYVRPKEYYLRLDKTRDVIEWQLDDTLDINGWDLKKALVLLHSSNPTLFEWNQSPIIYKTTPEWQQIACIINDYFVEKSGLYHYLNTAKRNYNEFLLGETVKYKKYFYVLRPILACKWIIKEGTPPPMLFSELCERYLDDSIRDDVEKLLEIKIKTPEKSFGEPFGGLNFYIEQSLEEISNLIESLPHTPRENWEELNSIFVSMLQ